MPKDDDLEATLARVRLLYGRIVNGSFGDVGAVAELERLTRKQFRSTSEFHNEISGFLARKGRVSETIGTRLRRARRKAKLTQAGLAKVLGVTKRSVIRWETNEIPPSQEALGWLNGGNGLQGEK